MIGYKSFRLAAACGVFVASGAVRAAPDPGRGPRPISGASVRGPILGLAHWFSRARHALARPCARGGLSQAPGYPGHQGPLKMSGTNLFGNPHAVVKPTSVVKPSVGATPPNAPPPDATSHRSSTKPKSPVPWGAGSCAVIPGRRLWYGCYARKSKKLCLRAVALGEHSDTPNVPFLLPDSAYKDLHQELKSGLFDPPWDVTAFQRNTDGHGYPRLTLLCDRSYAGRPEVQREIARALHEHFKGPVRYFDPGPGPGSRPGSGPESGPKKAEGNVVTFGGFHP